MRPLRPAAAVLVFATLTPALAFEKALDRRTLERAIDIGASRIERIREQFHAEYRFASPQSPVDYIDVVTPFRKVVLAAEEHARAGNRLFGLREAGEALGAAPDALYIHVELTFHPLNTYVLVPQFGIALLPAAGRIVEPAVLPQTVERLPRYGPRVHGPPRLYGGPVPPTLPGGSEPLTGGSIIAAFGSVDANGVYDVLIIDEHRRDVARIRVDLGRLR